MTDYQILRLYRRLDDDEEGGDVDIDDRGRVALPETPVERGSEAERVLFFSLGGGMGVPRDRLEKEWAEKRGKANVES